MASLESLSSLKFLNLERTQVGYIGLTRLKELLRLLQVQLKGTKFTDNGVAELRKALPNLRIIR